MFPCEPVGVRRELEHVRWRAPLASAMRGFVVTLLLALVAGEGVKLEHELHALAVGPTAYSKAITVNNTTTTLLRYSSTSSQQFAVCTVATSGLNVFLVDPTAADTTNGEGPYCDTCANGPRFVAGNDYARTSAGTGTVRCRFYDAPLGASDTGGGLAQGLADTLYCKLSGGAGCTMTGEIRLSSTVGVRGTDAFVALNSSTGATDGYLSIPGGTAAIAIATATGASGAQHLVVGSTAFSGSKANVAIANNVWCASDSESATAGGTNLFCVDGVGQTVMATGVSANNNLAGTSACAAAGDVGKEVLYNDTSTSKITRCVCEQTAAATFAWGAVSAVGDCT